MRPDRARRMRFSLRALIVAVALAALPLGLLAERRHRFRRIAERFRPAMEASMPIAMSHAYSPGLTERADWNVRMFHKYDHAARHPWQPIGDDPPEPK